MKTLFMILLVLTITSCSENPIQEIEQSSIKFYSGESSIDLNDDGEDDLRWELNYITNGIDTDVILSIQPRNNSKSLYNYPLGHLPFEKGDTIKFEVIQPLIWSPYGADIASKRLNNNQWKGSWIGKTAYFPIKFSISDSAHLGWVNLTMDTLKQQIIFNYSDFSIKPNGDFIITD